MVDVAEAANRLGLSLSKTKRLVVAGELGSVLIGRRRKVPVSAIESYISRLEEEQLRLPGMDAAR
jgi:excisionase family DNA binding protein